MFRSFPKSGQVFPKKIIQIQKLGEFPINPVISNTQFHFQHLNFSTRKEPKIDTSKNQHVNKALERLKKSTFFDKHDAKFTKLKFEVSNIDKIENQIGELKNELSSQLTEIRSVLNEQLKEYKLHSATQNMELQTMLGELSKLQKTLDSGTNSELGSLEYLSTQVKSVADHLDMSSKEQVSSLKAIADIDSQELDKLKKLNENSESKLATGVAYTTILGGLFGVINLMIFIYQYYDQQSKEEAQKLLQLEKLKLKAEQVQQEIERIQLRYADLKFQEGQLTRNIADLKIQKETLMNAPKYFFLKGRYAIEIIKTDNIIKTKESELERVQKEMFALKLHCSHQRDLEAEHNNKHQALYEHRNEVESEKRSNRGCNY